MLQFQSLLYIFGLAFELFSFLVISHQEFLCIETRYDGHLPTTFINLVRYQRHLQSHTPYFILLKKISNHIQNKLFSSWIDFGRTIFFQRAKNHFAYHFPKYFSYNLCVLQLELVNSIFIDLIENQ